MGCGCRRAVQATRYLALFSTLIPNIGAIFHLGSTRYVSASCNAIRNMPPCVCIARVPLPVTWYTILRSEYYTTVWSVNRVGRDSYLTNPFPFHDGSIDNVSVIAMKALGSMWYVASPSNCSIAISPSVGALMSISAVSALVEYFIYCG